MARNIARFEELAYLGLILAVVEAPLEILRATSEASGTPTAIGAAKVSAILGEFLGIAIGWLPIWLVARRGKNWARWFFLLVYLIALGFTVANYGRAGRLFDALNAMQAVFWTGALYFLFSGEAPALAEPAASATSAESKQPREAPARVRLAEGPAPAERKAPVVRQRVAAGRRVVVAPGEIDHRGKVEAHVAEMREAGIAGPVAAPPLFRLLWATGLAVPPPLFLGFMPIMLIAAAPFLLVWVVVEGLMGWMGLVAGLLAGVIASLLFGALIAAYYRHRLKRLSLPSWENYLPAKRSVRP